MFGNKKRMSSEEIKAMKEQVEKDIVFYHQMADAKAQIDANISEIDDSRRQVEQEIAQVNDNVSYAASHMQDNISTEASMIFELENLAREMKLMNQDNDFLRNLVAKNYEQTAALVDANKHFTSPSKSLQELPGELKLQNKSYKQQMDFMAEYSKQMGVLALNAAIEAGRMGESGMQFVDAAEQIRNYVSNYNNCIEAVRNQIEESEAKLAQAEETIKRLISLLKENNVATGKLLKNCGDVQKAADKVFYGEYPDRVEAVRGELIGVKNSDEELLKTEERNRMQIADMEAEFEAQLKNEDELLRTIEPFFEKAKDEAETNALEVEQL